MPKRQAADEAAESRKQQNREAGKRYRASDKGKATRAKNLARAKGQILPQHHGTENGYKRYGCRCDACRAAHADYNRKYPESIPGPARIRRRSEQRASLDAAERRRRWLWQYHKMTPADWESMWANQQGRCYLCCEPMETNSNGRRPSIDHDHQCCKRNYSCAQCRRGLACHPCNTVLGMVHDEPSRLRRIANNLERTQREKSSNALD